MYSKVKKVYLINNYKSKLVIEDILNNNVEYNDINYEISDNVTINDNRKEYIVIKIRGNNYKIEYDRETHVIQSEITKTDEEVTDNSHIKCNILMGTFNNLNVNNKEIVHVDKLLFYYKNIYILYGCDKSIYIFNNTYDTSINYLINLLYAKNKEKKYYSSILYCNRENDFNNEITLKLNNKYDVKFYYNNNKILSNVVNTRAPLEEFMRSNSSFDIDDDNLMKLKS